MKPLFFILRKTLKNYIKELKKKPGTLIAYIFFLLFIILVIVASFFMPQNRRTAGTPEIFGAVVTAVSLILVYFGLKNGITNGGSFFRLSDVNFVFTSPISPQKVLVYGFIKQLAQSFMIIIFFIFQIPNLKNIFPIVPFGALIIFLAVFLIMFSMSVIGVVTYSIASRSKKSRNILEKAVNILVGAVAAGYIFVLVQVKDVKQAAILYLNSSFFAYFPFIGWLKQVLLAAMYGVNIFFFINLFLIIAFIALLMYTLYRLNTDYYEDVLDATEYKEELIKNKRQGKMNGITRRNSKVKVKKVDHAFNGMGAKAIFYRQLLEYRKTGFYFINKLTLGLLAGGIIMGLFIHSKDIRNILYLSIYIQFIFFMQGKWPQELSKPYIYLIPAGSFSKVFYATLTDNLKNLVDGIVLFTAVGILFKANIIIIILCIATYVTFGSLFIYGDVLSRRLFGSAHSKQLEIFLKMILLLFLILPGLVVSIIVSIIFAAQASYLSYAILIAYNVLLSSILLLLSKGIFENLEMS
ncbi:MAG: putative ABC exporter domain-containing protein [Bacillota bacterium]|nr:putative ABC exporter domain-containing protein [Bacillota bacterium]